MQEPGNESAEVVMKRFDELYRKYKFMEANLVHKKKRLLNIMHAVAYHLCSNNVLML